MVGSVKLRTVAPTGEELAFENRTPAALIPPSDDALRIFLEYMDARTIARCAHASIAWHEECYRGDDEGRPLHPAYLGIHLMERESDVEAFEDKVDALFFHQPPFYSTGQLFASGQRSVRVWRRVETTVRKLWCILCLNGETQS
ncbi:unnamed protein product [Sphacelaria rigidula]